MTPREGEAQAREGEAPSEPFRTAAADVTPVNTPPARPVQRIMTRSLLPTLLLALIPSLAQAADGFTLADKAGEHMDVLLDGKIVARYMYAYDKSTKERLNETYKPYLHVFDADGKAPITQGAGGKRFPHHRGIFIGFKLGVGGKSHDRWHMSGGEIAHQKFADQKATPDQASFTSVTHWNDPAGQPLIVEERTLTFRRPPGAGRVIIDFASSLKAVAGDTTLGGDREHAGVHFRPAGDILTAKTRYLFPAPAAQPTKDVDYPWVGEAFTLPGDKTYFVALMNHPDNPKGTQASAYRDYGRFGFFAKSDVKKDEARVLKYRFLVADGQPPAADYLWKLWSDHAGTPAPNPVPATTLLPDKAK
ncbi:MAG TPA: DUF6807 family protein [Tepidisphaeraceae bacterium]|nr:DUF6807 family protein [Tepidisphaeraceae bacterium]